MSKIRVLQTIRQGKIGGGESHVLDLVESLDKDKFEPIVLAFTPGKMIERLEKMGIESHIIETEKPFDVRVWGKVKKLIQKKKIDLVHAHGTRANSNVLWASKKMGLPILYTVHGWSFHDDQKPLLKKLRVLSEKFLSNKVTHTISVSESNQSTAKKEFGKFDSVLIKYGINQKKFDPNADYKNIREEYGIDEEDTLIGYFVRMTKQKDPLTMVHAFAEVLETEERIKLLMVGDGELKKDAIDLIDRLAIREHVVIDGFRTDIPDLLNAIDIYCLPSLWEGLPIGMLEALAMEKAVVVSNVDGSKEVIIDGENGMLIEVEDYVEMAKKIKLLHRDKDLRSKIAFNALETVNKNFNVSKMTRKIENLYLETLNISSNEG